MTAQAQAISKNYQGIGGWLLIPLFGIIINILLNFYYVYTEMFLPITSEEIQFMISPPVPYSDSTYLQVTGTFLFSIIGIVIFQILGFFLLLKFLLKSKDAPKLYILWCACNITFQIIILTLISFLPAVAEALSRSDYMESIKELSKTISAAFIWIPYFIVSKRVKNTFVC